jgi:ERO1-like protein beta
MNSLTPFKKCDYTTKDFCVLDDEASANGVYVDLLKNPERFTGYDGEAAHRIWRSIYEENCFTLGAHHFHNKENPSASSPSSSVEHPFDVKLEECMEKRVFYKLISGLHSSITTHICSENRNKETGEWFSDLECYVNRVASYPDRVENIYFTYVVILRAVSKLSNYLKTYDFCTGDEMETIQVKSLVNGVLSTTLSCPSQFDEKLMFTSQATEFLKEEFKDHFRNVSRIMDCVSCEKCRLWGKLQVSGLGTALKVLFSYTDK